MSGDRLWPDDWHWDDGICTETPAQALARVQSRGIDVAVLQGEFFEPVSLTSEEVKALTHGQLYIALFNLSGQTPLPENFDGLPNKTDKEWTEMYGGRRPQRALPVATGLLPETRMACAPLSRRSRNGFDVLSAALEFRDYGWVTHFAIGSSKGVHVVGAFNDIIPAKPGNGYSFGLRLDIFETAVAPQVTGRDPRRLT